MLDLSKFLLLAFVAATPAIVTALSSHPYLGEQSTGNALRGSAVFSLAAGLLVLGGGYMGEWLLGMLQGQQKWIANSLWFVVGLKMILASRPVASHPHHIDMDKMRSVVMIGMANGLNAMLIGLSLGLLQESLKLFSLFVSVFVFFLSLSCFFLPGNFPILKHKARYLYPISGTLMLLLALLLF